MHPGECEPETPDKFPPLFRRQRALQVLTGVGRKRDRHWFASQFLSNVMRPDASMTVVKSDDERPSNPWKHKCPYETFTHPTRWVNRQDGSTVTFPAGTPYLWLKYRFRQNGGPWRHQDELLMERYAFMANGWTKDDIGQMKEFLGGRSVIFNGLLRVIPMVMKYNKNERSISSTEYLLRMAEEHILAGRIPMLKDQTKADLINKAVKYEAKTYGTTTVTSTKIVDTRSLFDNQ